MRQPTFKLLLLIRFVFCVLLACCCDSRKISLTHTRAHNNKKQHRKYSKNFPSTKPKMQTISAFYRLGSRFSNRTTPPSTQSAQNPQFGCTFNGRLPVFLFLSCLAFSQECEEFQFSKWNAQYTNFVLETEFSYPNCNNNNYRSIFDKQTNALENNDKLEYQK